ncbi:MAG TPA: 50S ribosomal protein L29 [Dehalococcoidales bacterium]|nr:50S ribosomal protein L29 [Dehalococcoidales bacterium]
MKVSEVRAMSSEELTKQLQTANRELFDLRLKSSTKQLVNHREIPRTRRKIAIIQTIIRERELAGK